MAREVDLLQHLPPVLHEIKEFVEIANTENQTINALWQNVADLMNDRFIVTATENGISRREKALKIHPSSSDSIETRRFRLLTRYQEQAPYSWKVLQQLLNNLLGEGKYELTRNVAEKWLRVKLELTVKGQFQAVEAMLERITPQNMVLTVELRYNQHSLLSQYTHTQLATFTHKQLREEVLN